MNKEGDVVWVKVQKVVLQLLEVVESVGKEFEKLQGGRVILGFVDEPEYGWFREPLMDAVEFVGPLSELLEVVGGRRFGGGVPDFSDFTEERSAKGQEGGYGIGFLPKPFPGFLGVDSDLGKIGTEIMGGFFEGGKIKPELGSAIRLDLVFESLVLSLQKLKVPGQKFVEDGLDQGEVVFIVFARFGGRWEGGRS